MTLPAPDRAYRERSRPSRTVTGEPGQQLGPVGRFELVRWQPGGCMEGLTLRALPNVQAGVLRSDQPKSFEACRNAAGTGFWPLDLASVSQRNNRGVVPGAAVCSVTSEGSVAMAVIEHIDQAVSVTASPSVTGDPARVVQNAMKPRGPIPTGPWTAEAQFAFSPTGRPRHCDLRI